MGGKDKYQVWYLSTTNSQRVFDTKQKNGNHMWRDGIANDINAVMIEFKLLDEGENPPPTYQEIRCHMIFDIKMEDFRRKARYVAGGHATVAPPTLTYASFVLQESVCIDITLYVLNDLDVKTSNIQNEHLTAPCSEKIWATLA